ncbi:NAD-dependent protein deacylase sirtuin-5, mitochondrial isoform X2 [Monodelphis domestica]|nr:NAD-dependent protein deacylase sirtuin-5, mitochondrial isoform X2 [Monodelphis domestica]XP_056679426.1 NAD-dependent protein deacylase sirtuin-5, mitochondrial isoform X2 [Monodelphis domestica]XP_056679427.1 NAD-dependent protein deacylase sirtuin-5, mitochondrial isoform X2 [Monodelphis domestica]XP_056679428.1 NAD-dependent protein deacylase sirtuin-5, mitochondrial isoform X2 [Monodelphis domestica]XP_056679429.1 NAD-dependent protein deacylase sirtuin-5, mitochondrial isoform X2 [Mon
MSLLHFATRRLILQVLRELGLKAPPVHKTLKICIAMSRPSSNMADFRRFFARAKHIAIITGAGVSAESGVPTFRGPGGFWRKWKAEDLATPEAFAQNPSLVWEFYHYRREVILKKHPNAAHVAIAACEERLSLQGRRVVVITQNIDEFHTKAGTKNILELHGSLFKTRCCSCGNVRVNYNNPICPALEGKGLPDPNAPDAQIPLENLPRCQENDCNGLLRPHVVWFGEHMDPVILDSVNKELAVCDLGLVVGTSSLVYPAGMFGPHVALRGIPVAEFNTVTTPVTQNFRFHFSGLCGTTIPEALSPHESEKTG